MKIIIPILFLFVFTGCYEPTEGCLDANATNFDVTADNACDDCCTYPNLKLKVAPKIIPVDNPDTVLSFTYGALHRVFPDTTHRFKVEKISFLASNFKLVTADGDEIGVKGALTLQTPLGEKVVENNFAKINAGSSADIVLGKLQHTGTITKVKFLFGVSDDVIVANPAAMSAKHPLSIASDSTNWSPEEGYIANSIDFKRDTFATTPVTQIDLLDTYPVELQLAAPKTVLKGHDIKMLFSINYLKWFDGIDFVNDSDEVIYQKINGNVPHSFFDSRIE